MTLVASMPKGHRLALRLAVAIGALLFASLVVFGLGALIAGNLPAAPKHPFGVGINEAAAGGSSFGRWLLAQQEWFYRRMTDALKGASGQQGFALGMILLAFAYGVFHAGGPGHGKAVISAYLIANERALWRGIALSTAAALLQALVAVAIVLVASLILHATAFGMTRLTNYVELASFAAIMLFGLVLTWRKALPVAAQLSRDDAAAADGSVHEHDHDDGRGQDHHHHHHDHGHAPAHNDHGHEHCDHHVPVEFVEAPGFRWRDALPVLLAAGSRPCSGAILILVFALSQGLMAAGLAAVFAMAAGVAITVSTLAIVSVFAKRFAQNLAGGGARFTLVGSVLELLAAAFVAIFGFGLMSGLAMISAG